MPPFSRLATRSAELDGISPLALNLLYASTSLLLFSLLLVSILLIVRRRRRAQKLDQPLPLYKEPQLPPARPFHRRTQSTYSVPLVSSLPRSSMFYSSQEKFDQVGATASPPPSPLPEIRVTFPDEIDDTGKYHLGRVVVVHVGENSEGLEPLDDEDHTQRQETKLEPFPTLSD